MFFLKIFKIVLPIQLHTKNVKLITVFNFSECVALQDPYCAWDKIYGVCIFVASSRGPDEQFFFQNITTGSHPACPASTFGRTLY